MERSWVLKVGTVGLLLILSGPAMASAILTNAGMLALCDGLLAQDDIAPGAYPYYNDLPNDLIPPRAMGNLRQAVALDEDSLPARWALGRAALAASDPGLAVEALQGFAKKMRDRPLIYRDTLVAFSYGGKYEEAVSICISMPHQTSPMFNDSVALACLDAARETDSGQNETMKRKLWKRLKELRPSDLYINYRLWQMTHYLENMKGMQTYREDLRQFSIEAIEPTSKRLLDYAFQVIPDLLEEGIWSQEKALNVVSYLIWQRDKTAEAKELLATLIEHNPDDPVWPFYLGEVYYCQGNLEKAEIMYNQALAVSSEYARAYKRLGMVGEVNCESRGASCRDATEWYARYIEVNPYDLLGLKRLATLCTMLEENGANNKTCSAVAEGLAKEPFDYTQDRQENRNLEELPDSSAEILWTVWRKNMAVAKPQFPVDQKINDSWTFLGYDVDERRLIRGEPVDLLLYWESSDSTKAGAREDGWYQVGERWVQVLERKRNLVFNGSFELGTREGVPVGFPNSIYHSSPDTIQLAVDIRSGQYTTVAVLNNTRIDERTSLVSDLIPVDPDGLYLQGGWMRSREGSGHIGRRWWGDLKDGLRPYSYVAAGVTPNNWHHYTGVVRPLKGSAHCQMWLLSFGTKVQVYFDNVFFTKVGLPGE